MWRCSVCPQSSRGKKSSIKFGTQPKPNISFFNVFFFFFSLTDGQYRRINIVLGLLTDVEAGKREFVLILAAQKRTLR